MTAKKAVFNFLRDQLRCNLDDRVQRGFYQCPIDEAEDYVEIHPQAKILNTSTIQQFVSQYEKLAGFGGYGG